MNYLTGKGMIDDVMSVAPAGGTAMRAKVLTWANIIAQKLATERPWQFLKTSAVLMPEDNIITLPADYGEFQSLQGGGAFLLAKSDNLTAGEAFIVDKSASGTAHPVGYTEGQGFLKMHGATCSETITLAYVIEPQSITDSLDATCWPSKCRALFYRTMLTAYYEFDFDERQMSSLQIDAAEMYALKKWDNRQKPIPQSSRKGYRRSM